MDANAEGKNLSSVSTDRLSSPLLNTINLSTYTQLSRFFGNVKFFTFNFVYSKIYDMIGLQYRLHRRNASTWLLQFLVDSNTSGSVQVTKVNGEDAYKKIYRLNTIDAISHNTVLYDKDILTDAALLLLKNEHVVIEFNKDNAFKNQVRATMEGELAYNEGYYKLLNKKDRTEANESVYKGWIPVIAIVLSIVSFIISVLK